MSLRMNMYTYVDGNVALRRVALQQYMLRHHMMQRIKHTLPAHTIRALTLMLVYTIMHACKDACILTYIDKYTRTYTHTYKDACRDTHTHMRADIHARAYTRCSHVHSDLQADMWSYTMSNACLCTTHKHKQHKQRQCNPSSDPMCSRAHRSMHGRNKRGMQQHGEHTPTTSCGTAMQHQDREHALDNHNSASVLWPHVRLSTCERETSHH